MRIGVAMADTLMWQRHEHPMLQGVYALFLPLLERGIPVSSFVMERADEPAYLSRFDVIVLSYESLKPIDPGMHTALAQWVKRGGSLLVLGEDGDALDACADFWWRQRGFDSPLRHLLSELGTPATLDGPRSCGAGWVLRNPISPARFADPAAAQKTYLRLIEQILSKAGKGPLAQPGSFCLQRGPFVVAHAETERLRLKGRLLDVFDPNLRVMESVELTPGNSGLYRDVTPLMDANEPVLLHATHRLVSCARDNDVLRFTVYGPAETPGVARIFFPAARLARITAIGSDGRAVDCATEAQGDTILVKFPNAPQGVTIEIR